MSKVKLPRKRKKAYKNQKGTTNYMAAVIVGEMLVEEGLKNGNRFYDLLPCKPTHENPNGLRISKRW